MEVGTYYHFYRRGNSSLEGSMTSLIRQVAYESIRPWFFHHLSSHVFQETKINHKVYFIPIISQSILHIHYILPWRRAWRPTTVFLPEESHGQRSLAGYSPYSQKESDATEATQHEHALIVLSAEKRFLSLQKDPCERNTPLTMITVSGCKLLLTFSLRIFLLSDVNELSLKPVTYLQI